MKFIGIVGSRRRITTRDYLLLVQAFESIYGPGDWLISGGCKVGADAWAERRICIEYGAPMRIHDADWETHEKAAGPMKSACPIRGITIAQESDIILAVVAQSRDGGTEVPIKECERLGKPVILI